MNSMNNAAQTIYSGAADIGQAYSTIQLISGIVVAILLCSLAVFFFKQKNPRTQKTLATINNINCSSYETMVNNKKQITQTCNLDISYTINGTLYNGNITSDIKYTVGNTVLIEYDPNNPNDIGFPTYFTIRNFGIVSSVIALLIFVSVVVNYQLSKNYKMYAATQGAFATVDITKGLTQRIFN